MATPTIKQETQQMEVTVLRADDDASYALVFHNADIGMTATLMVRHENDEFKFATAEGWAAIPLAQRADDAAWQLGDEIERMGRAAAERAEKASA